MPSLIEAIESKYSQSDYTGPQDGSFVIFVPKACARDCVPCILILDNCDVDSAGEEDRLAKLCCNVQELVLSHNKLTDWKDIAKILRQAPTVTFVNLSFNQLSSPLERSLLTALPNLQSLVLIGTNVSWDTVWIILNSASNLKELHLSKNSFDLVNVANDAGANVTFSCVTKLMFDGNLVSNWDEVLKLGEVFSELKQLSLSDCPIRSIPKDAFDRFRKLEILNVSGTLLQDPNDIVNLNYFPALSEIRATGIPFLDHLPDKERRTELVALLSKICKLNGGATITEDEREGSERYYVRKYLKEIDKPVRYLELVEKHGTLDPLVELKLNPVTKVTLRIKFGNMEVEKEVNLYQSVRSFKKFLEPTVGIEPARMLLYYNDVGLNSGADLLIFPNRNLFTYNMQEGDEIYVELKNSTNHEINNSCWSVTMY